MLLIECSATVPTGLERSAVEELPVHDAFAACSHGQGSAGFTVGPTRDTLCTVMTLRSVDNAYAIVGCVERLWPMMADARHLPLKEASVGFLCHSL